MKKSISTALVIGLVAASVSRSMYAAPACPDLTHQGECSHQHASGNLGPCWNNGGNGYAVCEGQDQSGCTDPNTKLYLVNSEFPQSCDADLKGDRGEMIEGVFTVTCTGAWEGHNNCKSDPAQCYRQVTCTWSGNPAKCIVTPGSGGAWISVGKRKTEACT